MILPYEPLCTSKVSLLVDFTYALHNKLVTTRDYKPFGIMFIETNSEAAVVDIFSMNMFYADSYIKISWFLAALIIKLEIIAIIRTPLLSMPTIVVSRGSTVLVKYAACAGNFTEVTEQLIAKIPPHNDKLTYSHWELPVSIIYFRKFHNIHVHYR
ncbi:hypothetical protein NQ317_013829 [Molorchus minor]|uniref:Uncharacterized protein n=1 Tax=Molorchus minor TaxID=1323400 RepID=A0ABQ9JT29_9CUCU|nr:hypothetical protein NQ317_013829 [Molorchus minor]